MRSPTRRSWPRRTAGPRRRRPADPAAWRQSGTRSTPASPRWATAGRSSTSRYATLPQAEQPRALRPAVAAIARRFPFAARSRRRTLERGRAKAVAAGGGGLSRLRDATRWPAARKTRPRARALLRQRRDELAGRDDPRGGQAVARGRRRRVRGHRFLRILRPRPPCRFSSPGGWDASSAS